MERLISFLIGSLICSFCLFSAKPTDSIEEKILGYWHSCDTASNYYLEVYFLEEFTHIYLDLNFIVHDKYKIRNDTLYLSRSEPIDYNDFSIIEYIDENTLILSRDNRKFYFSRIPEEINYDINFSRKERDNYHDNIVRRSWIYCDY